MRYSRYQMLVSLAIALGCILIASSPATAQGSSRRYIPESESKDVRKVRCSSELSQAPELRGFRLGMDIEQVSARFPTLKIAPADEFGFSQIELKFQSGHIYGLSDVLMEDETSASINRSRFSGFDGIKFIRFKALDNHIFFLKITYDDTVKWNGVDEYVAQVSKTLNLSGSWTTISGAGEVGSAAQTKTLDCAGFRITAGIGGYGIISDAGIEYSILALEDLNSESILEKRRTEAEQQQQREEQERRRSFKP